MTKVGIFGSGQLARMMALAVRPFGIEVICAGNKNDCASDVATVVEVDMSCEKSINNFLDKVDYATFETENIETEHLLNKENIYPPVSVLHIGQNRLNEKKYFNGNNMVTAPYKAVNSLQDLQNAVSEIGIPCILKTCCGGYDGKGQFALKDSSYIEDAWNELGDQGQLILEGFVDFDYEVSLIGVRARDGQKLFYPLTENVHIDGILHTSTVPSKAQNLQIQTEEYMGNFLDKLNYVGVMTIEFFVKTSKNGIAERIIANEMAPRVHNSGHWTIDGATSSQFENHIRAVAGLPLGDVSYNKSVMVNCIGSMPDLQKTLKLPNIKYHSYQKEPRSKRKVGHINLVGEQTISQNLDKILGIIK